MQISFFNNQINSLTPAGMADTFIKNKNRANKNLPYRPCFGCAYDVFLKKGENYDGIEITGKSFGRIQKTGDLALLYTIKNKNGASVDLSSFGACITSLKIPDKNDRPVDVVQGYSSVTPYETAPVGHAGGTIGPVANKISGGKFLLNGQEYRLDCNKDGGKNHSHGGASGFDVQNWKSEILKDGIKFTYFKRDMEGGHPGDLNMSVTYKLDNDNRLHIKYRAVSSRDTIINPTNHTYFNLDGAENSREKAVFGHTVIMPCASKYTPEDENGIPTGEIAGVSGTAFDFSTEKELSGAIKSLEAAKSADVGKSWPDGFDHNYCIDCYDGKTLRDAAIIRSLNSGIKLKVSTNLPGFQFYTANNLGKPEQPAGKHGKKYEKHSALCIEPQFFPDAINKFSEKPVLRAGENFEREIVYAFSTEK